MTAAEKQEDTVAETETPDSSPTLVQHPCWKGNTWHDNRQNTCTKTSNLTWTLEFNSSSWNLLFLLWIPGFLSDHWATLPKQPGCKEGHVDTVTHLGSMYKPQIQHTSVTFFQLTTARNTTYNTGIQIPDTGNWFHWKRTCTWLIHKNNKVDSDRQLD